LGGITRSSAVNGIVLCRATIIGSFISSIISRISATRCLIAGRLVASSRIGRRFRRVYLALWVKEHFQGAVRALRLIAKGDQALGAADGRIIISNSRGQFTKEVLLS